ncbi:MAG: LysR family transcriptional regulator, partial [Caulobacterales bacterium]|nr:LysR family transcriptional regulator [Caulobacterales bacterium]
MSKGLPAAPRGPEWSDYRLVYAAVQAGSLNRAAGELGMNHATLSRRLDGLEHQLSVRLIERGSSGVTLTPAGEQVWPYIESIARATVMIDAEVSGLDKRAEGEVSIACNDGTATFFLAPHLVNLHNAHPKLFVRLHVADEPSEVPIGGNQLAIVFQETKQMEAVAVELGVQHYCVFAAKSYLDRYGTLASPFEGMTHRVLAHSAHIHQIRSWAPKMPELDRILEYAAETNSTTSLWMAAVSGGGLAIMPSFASAIDPRLIRLEFPPVAQIRFWLVYHQRFSRSVLIRKTANWIKDIFKPGENPWFAESFIPPEE